MYLEGVDTLLYNLKDDPNEINNLSGQNDHAKTETELKDIALSNWDPEYWKTTIALNQQQRLKIHKVTEGLQYVIKLREDADKRYIRNAGAADTKARARLPFVTPAKPD